MPWVPENLFLDVLDILDDNEVTPVTARELSEALQDAAEVNGFTVQFTTVQELDRILYLLHRDLARTLGNIQISEERLAEGINSGSMRRKATEVLRTAPEQAEVIRRAQTALQAAKREAREDGQNL